eukprot:374140_1
MTTSLQPLWPSIVIVMILYLSRKIMKSLLSPLIDITTKTNVPKWLLPKWISKDKLKKIFTQYEIDDHLICGYFRKSQMNLNLNIPKDIPYLCLHKYYHNNSKIDLTQKQCHNLLTFIHKNISENIQMSSHSATDSIKATLQIDLTSEQKSAFKEYYSSVQVIVKNTKTILQTAFTFITNCIMLIYGIYVMIFKYDFFINHENQWLCFNENNVARIILCDKYSFIQHYDYWLKWYFVLFIGMKIEAAIHSKSRDKVANITHSILFVVLYICFWKSGMIRTGSIATFINQMPNIFLDITKIIRKWSGNKNRICLNVFFVLFCVSWFVFKILLYGQKTLFQVWYNGSYVSSFYFWIIFLTILLQQILNIYWSVLIFKVANKQIFN